jgi:hypothetical protein
MAEASEASDSNSVEEDEPVRLASQDEAVVVQEQPEEPAPTRLEIRVTEPFRPITQPQTTIVPQ